MSDEILSRLSVITPEERDIHQLTMGLLFVQLLNHTETLEFETAEQNLIVTVLRYIEENYRDGSLTEIARRTHYDLAALSRLIRRRTGKGYTRLLQQKRLSHAAWLLRNTERNVADVARQVGYENISYFHRLFSASFGKSPLPCYHHGSDRGICLKLEKRFGVTGREGYLD